MLAGLIVAPPAQEGDVSARASTGGEGRGTGAIVGSGDRSVAPKGTGHAPCRPAYRPTGGGRPRGREYGGLSFRRNPLP